MAIETRTNGVQDYYEEARFVVFRNHGEKRWWAMERIPKGGCRLLGQTEMCSKDRQVTGHRCRTFATAEAATTFARVAIAKAKS